MYTLAWKRWKIQCDHSTLRKLRNHVVLGHVEEIGICITRPPFKVSVGLPLKMNEHDAQFSASSDTPM